MIVDVLQSAVGAFGGTVGFCYVLNAPRRTIMPASVTGMIGFMIYVLLFRYMGCNVMLSHFAATVAVTVVKPQREIKTGKKPALFFAHTNAEIGNFQHLFAALDPGLKGKVGRFGRGDGLFDPLHSVQFLLAAFGQSRGRSSHHVSGNKIGQFRNFLLLGFIFLFLPFIGGLPKPEIGGIVAFIGGQTAVFHLKNAVYHRIQKETVVAHRQNSPTIIGQKSFQPMESVKIQMVGGLVQNQKIRCLQKQSGQGKTGFLSARKGRDRILPALFGKSQTV